MSNVAKKIGKKGLMAAMALDLLGILISFFVNANLTNDILLRVVLFCYCVRYELIAVLLFLIACYVLLHFFRSAREVNPKLLLGMTMLIIVAIILSIKPTKQYLKSRYYYYNNKLYEEESQKYFLDKAQEYMDDNEWDLCKESLVKADNLYPDSYYSYEITDALSEVNFLVLYCESLHNSFIKSSTTGIPLNTFKCSQTLCNLFPSKYEKEYLLFRDSVITAINSYQLLYKAVENNDYQNCRSLISKYGWCWFEPVVYDKLSHDNESIVMEWLNQYTDNEELSSAQCRMVRVWFGEDSISTIIH